MRQGVKRNVGLCQGARGYATSVMMYNWDVPGNVRVCQGVTGCANMCRGVSVHNGNCHVVSGCAMVHKGSVCVCVRGCATMCRNMLARGKVCQWRVGMCRDV